MTGTDGRSGVSRRRALQGLGLVAVTGASVAACGAGSGTGASSATEAATSGPLAKTSDIPVGGGRIFPAAQVVVTQPAAGQFKAFSTRCPHQGCAVSAVADGFIVCPCHGSRFAVTTGAPTPDSPAQQPLDGRSVSVQGGEVVLG